MATFRDRVYALVKRIPSGAVSSYGRIARALGHPRKAREVGWALSSTPRGLDLRAHRVVKQDGQLSGGSAFGAPEIQQLLLKEEGVTFLPDGRVDLHRHLWTEELLNVAAREVSTSLEPAGSSEINGSSGHYVEDIPLKV